MDKPSSKMTPEEKRMLLKVLAKLESQGKVKLSVNEKGETLVTLVRKEEK